MARAVVGGKFPIAVTSSWPNTSMAPSRASAVCARCARVLQSSSSSPLSSPSTSSLSSSRVRTRHGRDFSVSAARGAAAAPDLPRWQQTPPAMKMPFRLRPQPAQPVWRVNDRPEPVDEMYDRFLGKAAEAARGQPGLAGTRGRDMLPEEIKWLAITHKSFDHGRRGFNDRLAFLGKRIVDLQTSIALLHAPAAPSLAAHTDRHVAQQQQQQHDPALDGIDNVTPFAKAQVLAPARLAKLAQTYGIDRVVRWKPKKSDNLAGSGIDTILAHTVYSIIGALALQRGGEVAARTARERILQPLGLR